MVKPTYAQTNLSTLMNYIVIVLKTSIIMETRVTTTDDFQPHLFAVTLQDFHHLSCLDTRTTTQTGCILIDNKRVFALCMGLTNIYIRAKKHYSAFMSITLGLQIFPQH